MSAALYGLKNCDTCRRARKWLDAHGVEYRFVDYRDEPVPAETLGRWAKQLGGWDKLVNKSSPSWRKLAGSEKQAVGDAQWTRLIGGHPTLVRRPVLVLGDGSVDVGFSAGDYATRLGKHADG